MATIEMSTLDLPGRGAEPGTGAGSPRDRPYRPTPESDAVDGPIEPKRHRLRLRADQTELHTVAEKDTAIPGKPIRFTTVEVVGYLTVTDVGVVAVCSRCGCLLRVGPDGSLLCPASGTRYRPDGGIIHPRGHYRPPPLTRLHARLAGGTLQALVPQSVRPDPRRASERPNSSLVRVGGTRSPARTSAGFVA
jgi:hypothetical protein